MLGVQNPIELAVHLFSMLWTDCFQMDLGIAHFLLVVGCEKISELNICPEALRWDQLNMGMHSMARPAQVCASACTKVVLLGIPDSSARLLYGVALGSFRSSSRRQ